MESAVAGGDPPGVEPGEVLVTEDPSADTGGAPLEHALAMSVATTMSGPETRRLLAAPRILIDYR